MVQLCKFNEQPSTICDGGYKKGRWIIWLNLNICPNVSSISKDGEDDWAFSAETDRLVLGSHTIDAFLDAVDPAHIALASGDELKTILSFFGVEEDLNSWVVTRLLQIKGYDNSDKVNRFFLNGTILWLDKATRVGLVNSISIEKNAGRENTSLWFGRVNVRMNVDMALNALSQLELYALDCYNVTAQHSSFIESCEEVEAVKTFDITADYPEALQFDIAE